MRGLMVGAMLAATVLAGGTGSGGASAQLDSAAEVYLAEATLLSGMVVETLDDVVAANELLRTDMLDEAVRAEVFAETGVFEAVYEAAQELDPPPALQPAHDEMMLGFKAYAEMAPMLRAGIIELDGDQVKEAADLLAEGTEHIRTAKELLPVGAE